MSHGVSREGWLALAWLRDQMQLAFGQPAVMGGATPLVAAPVEGKSSTEAALTAAGAVSASEPRGGLLSRLFGRGRGPDPATQVVQPEVAPESAVGSTPEPIRALSVEAWRLWDELTTLASSFGLTDEECLVLLLAAAPELDSSFPSFCMALFGQASVPTFALADQLFAGSATWATVAERPLRHFMLLEVFQPGGTPLLQSEVHASEWVVERLRGGAWLDDRLDSSSQEIPTPERDRLAPSHQPIVDGIANVLRARSIEAPLAQLCGPAGGDKRSVAAAAAADTRAFRIRPDALSLGPGELDVLARLWEREDRVEPLVLFLDADDIDDQPEQSIAANVRRFVDRCAVPIVMSCREPWRSLDRSGLMFDLRRPTPGEQEAAWRRLLPAGTAGFATELAGQYDLDLDEIQRLATECGLPTTDGEAADDLADRLWAACRSHKRPQLEGLAQRIEVSATLDDLVLPTPERELIDQLIAQVRNRPRVYHDWAISARVQRGLGITAVFAGESGTGKTLAAEALASSLRLDLYRIDLSAVVDKYVGETEKNLRRLFDGGEDGGVLLFFDEADALFGKRTEVKESHDRYANIEINYLLQRIETYRGLVVLATNAKASMDPAFLRRLRFVVTFPFPGARERHRIWELTIPPARRGADLELDRLANLSLTGGHIRNIGLNALFLAAAAGEDAVSMAHATQAAATEFRKIGRPWNEDVLGAASIVQVEAA